MGILYTLSIQCQCLDQYIKFHAVVPHHNTSRFLNPHICLNINISRKRKFSCDHFEKSFFAHISENIQIREKCNYLKITLKNVFLPICPKISTFREKLTKLLKIRKYQDTDENDVF